ncbi:MAG: hypothetical protein ABWY48_04340, partial [Pseudoxanthomonas sp.]
PDPRVLRGIRQVALAGLALVLVWPAARGSSEWLGWLPMWLVGMPAVALWSLHRFRMPLRRAAVSGMPAPVRRRRPGTQARRRSVPAARRLPRAA